MSLHRGIGGSGPLEPEPVNASPGLIEERLARRSTRLASGTLACPSCDAPVVTPGRGLALSEPLNCGWCAHRAPVRDFLTLGAPTRPTRPTRVSVHVRGLKAPEARRDAPPRR